MKIVKLIDDFWLTEDAPEWIKNVLLVGDELPKLNHVYVVDTEMWDNNSSQLCETVRAYKLEGFDHLDEYHLVGFFKASRFEKVSDEHTPNGFVQIGDMKFICEKIKIIANINWCDDDK